MSAAKPFSVTVERLVPTQDGNLLACVRVKQKRWSLSLSGGAEVREGMALSVVEDGPGRVTLAAPLRRPA